MKKKIHTCSDSRFIFPVMRTCPESSRATCRADQLRIRKGNPFGSVRKRSPGETWDPFGERMSVRTEGDTSLCEIYFDNTAVKISGTCVLKADSLLYGKGLSQSAKLSLEKGVLCISAPKLLKNSIFSVKTTTAVAAIRGTEFLVSASGSGTTVSCLSGKVAVSVISQTQTPEEIISADETLVVNGSSNSGKKSMTAQERNLLSSQIHIDPLNADNAGTFDNIRKCDTATINRIKAQLESFYTMEHGSGIQTSAAQPGEVNTQAAAIPENHPAEKSDHRQTTAQTGRKIAANTAAVPDISAPKKTSSSADRLQRKKESVPISNVQPPKMSETPGKPAVTEKTSQPAVLPEKVSTSPEKTILPTQPDASVKHQDSSPAASVQKKETSSPSKVFRKETLADDSQPVKQSDAQTVAAQKDTVDAEKVPQTKKSTQTGESKQQKKGAPGGQTVPPYENNPYFIQ